MEEDIFDMIDILRVNDRIDYNTYIELHDEINDLIERQRIQGAEDYKKRVKNKLFFDYNLKEQKPVRLFYEVLDEIKILNEKGDDING